MATHILPMVGYFLTVGSAVAFVMDSTMLLIALFRENVLCGIVCILFPPLIIIFPFFYPSMMRPPFGFVWLPLPP